jgi:hypothetical protein
LERKKSTQTSSSVSSSRNSSKDSSTGNDDEEDDEEGINNTCHHHHEIHNKQRHTPSFKNKSILKSSSSSVVMNQQSSNPSLGLGARNNLVKEELVIRNSDSGKVMGIKGRRVKMIEEMSDTIISFQRVVPGVRDRLLQITGTRSESIEKAKQLILNTILRNCSPTPGRQYPPPTQLVMTTGNSGTFSSKGSSSSSGIGGGLQRSSSLGHVLKKRSTDTFNDEDYLLTESVFTGNPDQVLKVSANSSALLRESVQALKSHFELKKNLKRYLPEFEFEFGESDQEDEDSEADSEDFEVEGILSRQEKDGKQMQSILKKETGKESLLKNPAADVSESSRNYISKTLPIQSIVAPCDVGSSDEEEIVIPSYGKQSDPKRISYERQFLMDCSRSNLSEKPPQDVINNPELSDIVRSPIGANHAEITSTSDNVMKDGSPDTIDSSSELDSSNCDKSDSS